MEGIRNSEWSFSSTYEKLYAKATHSLTPERECMLSSVKYGHLKSLKCWLKVKRHPEEIFYEYNIL